MGSKPLPPAEGDAEWLQRIAACLDQQAARGETLTYLALADAVALPGPRRIHRLTRLLEKMLKADAEAGQPIRAAWVTSRARSGRPAPGFFERAKRLGLFDGHDPDRFHDQLLAQFKE